MIAAERTVRQFLAVFAGRPHPDGDARQAGYRLDDPVKLRRPEDAAELPEARRKVGDPHLGAAAVGQFGRDDRGVADILRLIIRHVLEHDVGEALFLPARYQAAEDRIAVKARIAPPHDTRARIDQGGGAAVADDREIKPVIDRATAFRLLIALRAGRPVHSRNRQIEFIHYAVPLRSLGPDPQCAQAMRAPTQASRNGR